MIVAFETAERAAKNFMPQRRYKVLAVAPIQSNTCRNSSAMATEPQLELHVAYCSPPKRGFIGPDFQVKVQWDVPLLDGYSWSEVPIRLRKRNFWD